MRILALALLSLASGSPLAQTAGTCTPSWQPTFGAPGPDDVVYSQAVFDDGTGPALYVGGLFNATGGAPGQFIARWNGSSWSALGAGMDQRVSAMATSPKMPLGFTVARAPRGIGT